MIGRSSEVWASELFQSVYLVIGQNKNDHLGLLLSGGDLSLGGGLHRLNETWFRWAWRLA